MKAEKQETKKKKHSKVRDIITIIIMVIAIGVFLYAAYQLYLIFTEYKAGEEEYDALREYVQAVEPEPESEPEDVADADIPEDSTVIDANEIPSCPISVDFDSLLNINADIVGWIYIEAIPTISYPIVQGEDNDYYLKHTVEGVRNTSASIFMDYRNDSNFMDSNTLIYGHNMKNQSMFGILSKLTEEKTFAKSPYIWIILPNGEEVCYQVFSARHVSEMDALYNTLNQDQASLKTTLERYQKDSEVDSNEVFSGTEKIITLSTCTSNDAVRCIVQAVRKDF